MGGSFSRIVGFFRPKEEEALGIDKPTHLKGTSRYIDIADKVQPANKNSLLSEHLEMGIIFVKL